MRHISAPALSPFSFLLSLFPMSHLFDFLRKYHYLLLFIVLEYVSLSLLIRFNSFQGSVWHTGANTVVAGIDRWYLDLWSYVHLGTVNRDLAAQNAQLMLENDRLREDDPQARFYGRGTGDGAQLGGLRDDSCEGDFKLQGYEEQLLGARPR